MQKIVLAVRQKNSEEIVWVYLNSVESLDFIKKRVKENFNSLNAALSLLSHGDIKIITSTGVLYNNTRKNVTKNAANFDELTALLDNHEIDHVLLYDCHAENPEWEHWTFYPVPEPKEENVV